MNFTITNSKLTLPASVGGRGSPLVLIPGGLTGWQSWEPFVNIFTGKHRKVIRVQLLNVQYGIENKELPPDYSMKTESEALEATLDLLGLSTPIDLVAWSYGAMITLDYALDHPGRIRSLTLIEPPAVWILGDEGLLDARTRHTLGFFRTLHGEVSEENLADFLQEVGFTQPGQSPRDLPQWSQWLPFKQSLRNSPAVVDHKDELNRLHSLTSPVLLVKGSGSAPFLHYIIDELASELPNSHIIELPGGHAPHIVSRDKFLIELKKFQLTSL